MYHRNTYLQLYKSSLNQQNDNLVILLRHFNQLYSALGCVLQDLEYQIGKQSFHSQPPEPVVQKQRNSAPPAPNLIKPSSKQPSPRQLSPQPVKVQESQVQPVRPPPQYAFQPKQNKLKKQITPPQPNQQPLESENNLYTLNLSKSSRKEYQQPDKGLMEVERPRPAASMKGSDSFDSLFDPTKNSRESGQSAPSGLKHRPLPVIEQAPNQQDNSEPMNTYDEFMQRILHNAESRKSRNNEK